LRPSAHDYFMFKPKHSGFYATPLAELLYMHDVQHIVLTGISSHQCVLLTASDAHVRNLEVTVVRDGIAAPRAAHTRHALFILEHGIRAQIRSARSIRL
jgi:nicotinamidase-related amidase